MSGVAAFGNYPAICADTVCPSELTGLQAWRMRTLGQDMDARVIHVDVFGLNASGGPHHRRDREFLRVFARDLRQKCGAECVAQKRAAQSEIHVIH
jgi:hypothetical protein